MFRNSQHFVNFMINPVIECDYSDKVIIFVTEKTKRHEIYRNHPRQVCVDTFSWQATCHSWWQDRDTASI